MRRGSILLTLVVAVALGGCTRWARIPTPEPEAGSLRPMSVRVHRAGGARFVLKTPYVRYDTLYGDLRSGALTAVPLDQVERVDVKKPDYFADVIVGLVTAVAAVYGLLYYSLATEAT